MNTMRRRDREVNALEEKLEIIDECKVFRIALKDDDGLYIVPMNFGYEYANDKLVLYFHCSKDGRKVNAIEKCSASAFEMDCGHALIEGEIACFYGYAYKCVMGSGNIVKLEEAEEKKKALFLIMKHQTGKDFEIKDNMANAVQLYKFEADNFTAKRRLSV